MANYNIGYEETDKKIEVEIFGLDFEVKNLGKLEKINEDDEEKIIDKIEEVLGEGSIDRINEKRKKDGYDELSKAVALRIITFLMKIYSENIIKTSVKDAEEIIDNTDRSISRIEKRAKNNRSRYNKYNRRYYN